VQPAERAFGLIAVSAVGVIAVLVLGAEAATIINAGEPFTVAPAVLLRSAPRVLMTPGDPRHAWPPSVAAALPGAATYWAATITVLAATTIVLLAAARRLRRFGSEHRARLGVDASARLARRRDLAPLIVRHAEAGRFILGRVGRHLVATEHRAAADGQRPWRRSTRRGDRSSVAIIGPTRCGKTAATIGGILEWSGPAILSSVKSDLMASTITWRRTLGDVRVFDPTSSTHEASVGWSPLRGAKTITGAQKATRALIDAGPRGGAENLDFFLRLAEQLIWPHLYIAATQGATMRDVVRWIITQEPLDDPATELAQLADAALDDPDERVRGEADGAREVLAGLSSLDERTRSSAYATAQTLLGAWSDPGVAAASRTEDIDLDWLLNGANTLYLCGPLHEQARLAPVFGGLLGDLVNQAYEHVARTDTPLPSTLLVLDEAANTPARWLPQVASTCAGIGLLLVTVWQSKAQIDAAYGALADSVLTNHGTKVIFAGVSDLPTLDYAARLLGDEQVLRRATTIDHDDGRRSLNLSSQSMPLLPAHVLRQTRPGNALLVHGTLPPAHLKSRPYYQERTLRSRADSRGPSQPSVP
jgi:type IV secretion system protein VirD4